MPVPGASPFPARAPPAPRPPAGSTYARGSGARVVGAAPGPEHGAAASPRRAPRASVRAASAAGRAPLSPPPGRRFPRPGLGAGTATGSPGRRAPANQRPLREGVTGKRAEALRRERRSARTPRPGARARQAGRRRRLPCRGHGRSPDRGPHAPGGRRAGARGQRRDRDALRSAALRPAPAGVLAGHAAPRVAGNGVARGAAGSGRKHGDVPRRGGGPRGDGAAWRRERPAGEGGREAGVRAGGDFPARLGHRPPNLVKDRWKPLICLSSVLTSGKWLFGVSFTSNKTLLTFAPGKEVPVKLRALTIRNHRPARRSCLLVARWRLLFPPEAQTAAPEEPGPEIRGTGQVRAVKLGLLISDL